MRKITIFVSKLSLRFLLAFGFCHAAQAACGLSLTASNLNLNWDMNWTTQAISVTVAKTNPAACTFGLGFTKGSSGSYTRYAANGGAQLNYQLYSDSGKSLILKDVPDVASANDVIMVTLPPGSNPQIVQYYFDIPYTSAVSPVLVTSGTFTDNFVINAYEGAVATAFTAPPDVSAPVSVSITTATIIALSLVDSGGVFQDLATTKTINFGNISTGQVSRFDLRLRTNSGFSITTTSTNNGRMKHLTANSYVPYQLYVNNVLADPTGVAPVLTGSGTTAMNGLGYPVKVVIGNLSTLAIAGSYQDTVTITATTTQ